MKKTAITILCCMILLGAWALHAVWAAYPGSVGQIGTDNVVQNSPLAVNVTGGTMTVLSVNGGTTATTSFGISGGTLDRVSALPALTISAGTLGNVTLSGTSSIQGAVSISGTPSVTGTVGISGGTLTSIPNLTVSSGTVTTSPLSYATTLGAYNVTAGTAATGVSGGTATTIPAGSRTVSVWTLSGTSNLLIGGGTVTLPSVPVRLDVSGGTMGFQSGSGTATVGAVFGG